MNENWIEVSEKKEIKKIKRNDTREIIYFRIALLNVLPMYVLRIVHSIFIMKEYTYKIGDVFSILLYTVILIVMVLFYRMFLKVDLVEKYLGTIWKTSGIVIEKKNDTNKESHYIVKCRKFGETCNCTYSCESDQEDIEIGDIIKVVGCKKEDSFQILNIYKSEDCYGDRGWILLIMNVIAFVGIFIFCPWSSHFGVVAIYCLIWKEVVWIVSIIVNLIAGIFEKNKLGISVSIMLIGIFLFFQEPQKLQNAIEDLYEGPIVMKNIELSFVSEKTPSHRGNPFIYYIVISEKTGLEIDKIMIPEAVYRYYTDVYRKNYYVVYYRNSGIIMKLGKEVCEK